MALVGVKLGRGDHLYDLIISLRGEVLAHKTFFLFNFDWLKTYFQNFREAVLCISYSTENQ
jgi:hypothetical protein